ncbi:MAG TPA: LPS export ABC transporter permease LptG [Parvularculaceae bacterium]|nr:LPS export ABC transporter permease LptG [Parvularculaceae bacterium]HNS86792.1 LPS export ABC transporter permease LptG [Parvularculaceae bacterium]
MPPVTLFRYIILRTSAAVIALFAALAALVMLVDLLENIRFSSKVGADFAFAAQVTMLRTPAMTQALAPFVFLFGSIWMFTQLNRRSELAVMRSAGLSIWRLIGPAAFLAAIGGLILIVFIDPISSHMMSLGEKMKLDSRGQASSLVRVFGDGIWLRQRDEGVVLLINADSFDAERGALKNVTIWRLDLDGSFSERIDAPDAVLAGRTIELRDAKMKRAGDNLSTRTPSYSVPTELTLADFRENVPPPESMSIWDLPRFILLAEAAGLSTVRYNIRFHDLCSTPLKLTAMVLIAAIFSMGPVRSGKPFGLLLAAVGVGFGLYIISEISTALGESGLAPEALAAWAPAIIAVVAAIAVLMRHEES